MRLVAVRNNLMMFTFIGVFIIYLRLEMAEVDTPSIDSVPEPLLRWQRSADRQGEPVSTGQTGDDHESDVSSEQRGPSGGMFPYLSDYKNPCWWNDTTSNLLCLPYFYLIGFGKSGTSTIFHNVCLHPEIADPPMKEVRYWTKDRLKSTPSILQYARLFKKATSEIQNHTTTTSSGQKYHNIITGEGTPSYVWEFLGKDLHRLHSNTKLILTMRHPTDRLFSHYHHDAMLEKRKFSPQEFHDEALKEINELKECFKRKPAEFCVTTPEKDKHPVGVSRSIYVYFIRAWLQVFPIEQMLFIQAEEFYQYPMSDFKKIFKFLELTPPERQLRDIIKASLAEYKQWASSVNKTGYRDAMWPSTKDILDDFYAPFNQMLYDLLNDNRFLFRRLPS